MNPFDLRHKNRWLYFALIIGIGGLGSWTTLGQHLHKVTETSGYTFWLFGQLSGQIRDDR